MSDENKSPDQHEDNIPRTTLAQRRWFWIRTVLLTVLIFVFVMWYTYPTNGNIAILWSAGLAAATLGYFVLSYFKLYR